MVAHGGVGTLLLCALAGYAIDRRYEQPGTGEGNYYAFDTPSQVLRHAWRPIEKLDAFPDPQTAAHKAFAAEET